RGIRHHRGGRGLPRPVGSGSRPHRCLLRRQLSGADPHRPRLPGAAGRSHPRRGRADRCRRADHRSETGRDHPEHGPGRCDLHGPRRAARTGLAAACRPHPRRRTRSLSSAVHARSLVTAPRSLRRVRRQRTDEVRSVKRSTEMNMIETEHIVIRSIAVSEMENNVYLLTAKETGSQVLIDAADDAEAIAQLVAAGAADTEAETALRAITTTQPHGDHIRARPAVSARHPEARTIAGADDAAAITEAEGVEIAHAVDHLDGGDFGGFGLEAICLRGHTPGSIALLLSDGGRTILFSGDSLFPGGPGKTWSKAHFNSLMDDLEERVFGQLADDTVVLPGHGDSTTVGQERPKLDEWRERGW